MNVPAISKYVDMKKLSSEESELIRELEKSRHRNINLINFIKNYPVISIYRANRSVLVKGRSDHIWAYLSTESHYELLELLRFVEKDDIHFAVAEEWMVPYISKARSIKKIFKCTKFFLDESALLPQPIIKIQKIDSKDAAFIFRHYKYCGFVSEDYIKERIENGIALGIYVNRSPIAWVITHDDGAMGCMNVLPEYRRRGYAHELTISLANILRSHGELVYVHIESDNIESSNLIKKIGFKPFSVVNWLYT